ncbi:ABC transporter permease (plasmid) [Sinorhizobium meliloti WSM1022]|jgi:peptide/nickel transport system permease protein|uniref:ABC transporter permease subunit n=1 Tax=Rhizobium meliloti TaxID=382 RepID=A0A6A7ZIC9_RHIML|nr:ABC transporter permease [Sinorhizobium meliloti]ASJ61920.1 ABC transporter permease [Sinorhizobium meliloti]ASQ06890.1 ABC transporter permease [Sinorhizobium meliloti]ASQ12239.1 ABC transporter permease [Sinorhizobium meliloti]MCK3785019.1 ABC transporter permease [Sinorhizobium meliloti]MCK3791144.1 ABC transporter permease [Sinorhizobium meliloti]
MELIMKILKSFSARLNKMPRAALITIGLFVALGTFAPWFAPQDPSAQNLLEAGVGPSGAHWLGTDHLGRDTFSRLIIAANTSLVSVGSVLAIAMTIGIAMGTIAGYHRGWVDDVLMRVVDVGLSIPSLIIALAVIGIVGPGYWTMVMALALAWWPMSGRISRAVAVSIMSKPHIEALRVLGASPWRIYFNHLLPGTIGAVMVYATADAGVAALAVATLSFLGLGIQPPTPEWGQMLVDALPYLESDPRQVILPGLALTAAVIGFNTLGESIALNRIPKPLTRRMLAARRIEVAGWAKESIDAK